MITNTQETVTTLQKLYQSYRQLTTETYQLSYGEKKKKYWDDVAAHILELNVIPERYVGLLFKLYPDPSFPPFPTMLNSQKLKDAARHLNQYEAEQAEKFWGMMYSLFNSHVKEAGRAPAAVLNDDTLYFNPPFRYAIAKFLGLPSTVELWHARAVEFCKTNPAYVHEMKKIGVTL